MRRDLTALMLPRVFQLVLRTIDFPALHRDLLLHLEPHLPALGTAYDSTKALILEEVRRVLKVPLPSYDDVLPELVKGYGRGTRITLGEVDSRGEKRAYLLRLLATLLTQSGQAGALPEVLTRSILYGRSYGLSHPRVAKGVSGLFPASVWFSAPLDPEAFEAGVEGLRLSDAEAEQVRHTVRTLAQVFGPNSENLREGLLVGVEEVPSEV